MKQTADENMAKHTWLVKAAGAMMCLSLAGCIGTGTPAADISFPVTTPAPPVVIEDPNDNDDPTIPVEVDPTPVTTTLDGDDDDNNIVDVIVDVATTTVSVTSITATGGS